MNQYGAIWFEDIQAITWEGKMEVQRVADLLPYEYSIK
jgi:hypothetical protein